MHVMNRLFKDLLDQGVVVFLDSLLIYSTMAKQHLAQLRKVPCKLQQYEFYYKLKNYSFLKPTISFFGFQIMSKGVSI